MRIHHLNCATLCPRAARLVHPAGHLVCHCLLIETPGAGLLLVDTGLGTADLAQPRERLGRPFLKVVNPRLDPDETALARIQALGFSPGDVRHIVLTHLDVDHAGGLSDFPEALVHVHRPELEAALAPRGLSERHRYRRSQRKHHPRWRRYGAEGEPWFGFEAVRGLEGLPPEILLIPLAGHTRGHAGVAVRTDQGWLLHAGDAYFQKSEMDPVHPRCAPALAAFQHLLAIDNAERLRNQARLRDLAREHAAEVRVFCAHDPDLLVDFSTARK